MIDLDDFPAGTVPPRPRDAFEIDAPPVENSPDLARILALPRRPRPDGVDLVDRATAFFRRHDDVMCRCADLRPSVVEKGGDPCIKTLRPIQAAALAEIGRYGGFLGPIGTGFGKTLIEILAPYMLAKHGATTTLLLVPANLVDQIERDVVLYGQHFKMPDVIIYGKDVQPHRHRGEPLLHVMSYNRLSLATAATFLHNLQPDAIIADECQNLSAIPDGSDRGSVRAGRVRDYIRAAYAAGRRCLFLAQSGSMTKAELDDYGHLAAWALANPEKPTDFATNGSPLPVVGEQRKAWDTVIGAAGDPTRPGALSALCDGDEPVRDAFRRRLHETRGVIATTEAAIDAALEIRTRPVKVPPVLAKMMAEIRDKNGPKGWIRPDGEELTTALEVSACLRQLACGLFLRWTFEHMNPAPSYELIMEWIEARKAWRKEMRDVLYQRRPRMDSPLLCALAAARAWGDEDATDTDEEGNEVSAVVPHCTDAPRWKAISWPRWRDVRKLVKPKTEAVRVDDYLARDAAAWGHKHRGVIWYETVGFGAWVAELSGLTWRHPGDPLIDPHTKELRLPADGSSVILTARSYGTGIDGLQYPYATQLFAQPPGMPDRWEQTLGRIYRFGQKAGRVYADVYRHTPELRDTVDEAVARAEYVQATMGAAQKLLIGWKE